MNASLKTGTSTLNVRRYRKGEKKWSSLRLMGVVLDKRGFPGICTGLFLDEGSMKVAKVSNHDRGGDWYGVFYPIRYNENAVKIISCQAVIPSASRLNQPIPFPEHQIPRFCPSCWHLRDTQKVVSAIASSKHSCLQVHRYGEQWSQKAVNHFHFIYLFDFGKKSYVPNYSSTHVESKIQLKPGPHMLIFNILIMK